MINLNIHFFLFRKSFSRHSLLLVALLWASAAKAATLEKTTWSGLEAYRLSEGKTEAVIVPALSSRVMRFGWVGGANWLWNAPPEKLTGDGYKNYGGDKTFAGPHPTWGTFARDIWPPDPTWDGGPHDAQVLPDGHLRTTGNVWRGFGVRVIRDFSFNAGGEFVVAQTIEKVEGEPRLLAVWPVTQVVAPDAVFLPLSQNSAYWRGFHPFGTLNENAKVEALLPSEPQIDKPFPRPTMLTITPAPGAYYKLGADSPVAALAALKDGVAFVQRAAKSSDQYPDGAENAGLPVEVYHHGDAGAGAYVELELLSPMRRFVLGAKWTHTVRWSLYALSSKDPNAPAVREEVKRLLNTSPRP